MLRSLAAICLRKACIFIYLYFISVYYRSVFVESSKAFNTLSKILLWTKPSYFSARFVTVFGKCLSPGACETGLFSSAAAVVPQKPHKVNLPGRVAPQPLCHTK